MTTTLTAPPLATLLDELFTAADASSATFTRDLGKYTSAERAAMMNTANYRDFYLRAKDAHLAVSRETGKLLYLLARAIGAHSIVEFGTSFGISTLHLAAALRDNGGGHLISTEFEPSKVARSRDMLASAGLWDLVEIREGDAVETLANNLPDTIDLVLLDGAKVLYPRILSLLEPHLRAGALVLADNADWSPEYLARVRSATAGYVSVPFADDVELSMKLGMPSAV